MVALTLALAGWGHNVLRVGASAVAQRVAAGRTIWAVVLLSLFATGCSGLQTTPTASTAGTPTDSVPPTDAEPATPDPAAARQALETVDLDNEESIGAVEALRFTAAGEQAAGEVLAAAPGDVDVVWAAAWVYASSASEPAPLRPLLGHSDASVRAIAAAGAVALGEADGLEVLRVLLGDDTQVRGAHPPLAVGTFAWATVSRYVVAAGAPAAPTSANELPGAKAAWSDWLTQNEAELQFDLASGTWGLP